MSAHLRRIIDFGPGAGAFPGSPNDYRFHDNRTYVLETGTSWIRLWADWPSLQPDPALAIDAPENPGLPWLQALDEQIAAACADGVRVVLVAHRFPTWANGTADLAAARNTDAEASFAFADRMSPSAWRRYVAAGRDPSRFNPGRRALEQRVPPEGLAGGGAWSGFFEFLYARYAAGVADPSRCVAGFELVNEANFFLWPQREPATGDDPFATTPLVVQHPVAQMMAAAQALADSLGGTTLLLAPGAADSEQRTRLVTGFDEFAAAVLDALDSAGVHVGTRMAWSHHNYSDVERRWDTTYLQRLRDVLRGRWTGFEEGEPPTVFVTEGGARLGQMRARYPAEDPLAAQAESLREAWDRHVRDDGPGAGVAMLAQYQTYSDPRFDAGLLDPWPSTLRRPAYDVWASLPRFE
jgi:hypothetical protein